VPADIFADFDYVALGHLHAPQRVKGERMRYAGSPLKYSLSEEGQKKAALLVKLGAELEVEELPYHPLRDVKGITGKLAELTGDVLDRDYVFITLTDELPPLDALGSLLLSYPNLVQHRIRNSRSGEKADFLQVEKVEEKNPLEHFVEFFAVQNAGTLPTQRQMEIMKKVIEEAEVKRGAAH